MTVFDRAFEIAKTRQARVVFSEMTGPRIAEAAAWMAERGVVTPMPLAEISEARMAALVDRRGVKERVAQRMLARTLFRAAAMFGAEEAKAMVAGAVHPMRRVIEAVGPTDGVRTVSSFSLMVFPDGREMLWADCGVNVAP